MKCLTVRQPFASLIVRGLKRCEGRKWQTSHRGLMLIHAAKEPYPERDMTEEEIGFLEDAQRSAIIGVVEVFACVRWSDRGEIPIKDRGEDVCDWFWRLRNPVEFTEPIPMPGMLSVWKTPPEFDELIASLLKRS